MGRFEEPPRKKFDPDLPPLKSRVVAYIVCVPLCFIMGKFKGFSTVFCVSLTAAVAAVLAVSVFFECRSKRRDAEFRNAVRNDEFHSDEKWQEKYSDYVLKNDFQQVTASSMKADLDRRFFKPSGVVWLIAAAIFFAAAIICRAAQNDIRGVLAVSGILAAMWGGFKLLHTPVRSFIANCGEKLPEIERSYLNGKMLTYRRNGEHSCNSGINIGGNYVVMYSNGMIICMDRAEIESVNKHITKTKHYGNGVYAGSVFTYSLIVNLKDQDGSSCTHYQVELNEFQVQMAYEALSVSSSPSLSSIKEQKDNV